MVADKKTPVDWHLKNSICLTIEMQKNLPYKIIPLLSFNHYSRKNIGYLYAIAHGAKIIYETDDDNEYIYNNIEFMPAMMQIDCCSGATNVTNIYSYFGQKDVWPRGFPLSCVMHCDMPNLTKKITQIPIQQGLVNHDPDVDAIYRLTHNRPIYFSDRSPIALDKAVFCPFNSQNTIFHYNAFWGLLLPISVSMRITDIWRSYWVQRIMWEHS